MIRTAFAYLKALIGEERAQDAFEYLLVIGGISVLVILAMVTPVGNTLISAVIKGVCLAINGIGTMNGITCP